MKRIFILFTFFFGMSSASTFAQLSIDYHQTAVTQFIQANGNRYAYRSFGKKEGIALILLQHFTGTMDNWDPAVTNGLAKQFQVVLFDNKGIGASEGQTPDNIEAMAQDAISFIKALGYKKVNLLGFSMGGFIAQQITLDEPTLVNKLILAGTGPKGSQNLADIVKPLTASAGMTPDEQKLYLFYNTTPSSRLFGQQSLNRINKRKLNRDPDTEMPAIQAQLKSILGWAQPDANAVSQLRNVRIPVLIVNGNNDIMVPTINSYLMYQEIPNAKLNLYPDSGHGSIFQYPAMFVNEALNFLK
ncbi:alpha/beta hydrolase [Pedobacter frigiditerrae]|uniref:Alpha/beta hydrolase n=1 Tax=Pedobacter frigiditerrae TaxID=2530452 RepID=A0A4V6N5S6_9SPHI|nr:alpha/beta hydrolase [Pedobacter frigiditerrae]TCC92376.1 alpha/beta hydrolase [Pedobacter frigiditerrae]